MTAHQTVPHESRARGMSRGASSARATRNDSAARAAGTRANSLRSNSARAWSGGLLAEPCGAPRVLGRRSQDTPPARSHPRQFSTSSESALEPQAP